MTRANFREGHPSMSWKPNLISHRQKIVGKRVHQSLEERVVAIKEEINKMKSDQKEIQKPLSN